MATTYNHTRLSVVDDSGNVAVMYPQNTAEDVTIDKSANANLPSSAANAQDVMNSLSSLAFATGNPVFFSESDEDQDLLATEIDDSITSSQFTWSSNKISQQLAAAGNTQSILTKNITIATSAWVSDASTFPDYQYKATLTINGATSNHICTVFCPDHTDSSIASIFGPYVETGTNTLTVWVNEVPDHNITIEAICLTLIL